jgi:hypothetical protein
MPSKAEGMQEAHRTGRHNHPPGCLVCGTERIKSAIKGRSMLAFRLRQTSGEERSRGRIRDQRVGPALKRAERNRNGTDGCRIRFRQFFTSSLHPLGNCISRCCTFCRKTSYFKGGTLLFSSADDPGRNSRTMEFHLTCGRPSCTVWWSRKNRSAP